MTIISFEQRSPKGRAEVDTSKLLIGLNGKMYSFDGPMSDGRIVPLGDEKRAALEAHFGPLWRDAVAAVKALNV